VELVAKVLGFKVWILTVKRALVSICEGSIYIFPFNSSVLSVEIKQCYQCYCFDFMLFGEIWWLKCLG